MLTNEKLSLASCNTDTTYRSSNGLWCQYNADVRFQIRYEYEINQIAQVPLSEHNNPLKIVTCTIAFIKLELGNN